MSTTKLLKFLYPRRLKYIACSMFGLLLMYLIQTFFELHK